jgi:hypothetical protein
MSKEEPPEAEADEEEEDEDETSEGIEGQDLVTKQIGDAVLEAQLEKNLMQAEALLSHSSYTSQDLEFALGTMVYIKNNILIKYNPDWEKGDSEEITKIEGIIGSFQDDPPRYIKALNLYLFPILKTRYHFGLWHRSVPPWEHKKKAQGPEPKQAQPEAE